MSRATVRLKVYILIHSIICVVKELFYIDGTVK